MVQPWGGPVRIPHFYNGSDHTFFYVAWEGERFDQGSTVKSTIPTLLNQQGDFSQTVINYDNDTALQFTPRSTTRSTAPMTPTPPTVPVPLAVQFASEGQCWVRPQFPGNKIPAAYGTGVSGQSKLFANYLPLWPQPNHAPDANNDHLNNRYDSITVTRPTDKLFFRVDEAYRSNQHIQASVSRSMLTNNIPPPFKHALNR